LVVFRHQICTAYGVKTIPAVRESIEQKQWRQADEQIVRVGKVLENAGERIEGSAIALETVAQ
jgi:N-acetylated-alpha-linked acidic dipeptidase